VDQRSVKSRSGSKRAFAASFAQQRARSVERIPRSLCTSSTVSVSASPVAEPKAERK
jgi:hypothetical protein